MRRILFLCVLCICSFQQVQSQTTLSKTYVYGGLTREYRIYIPAMYNATKRVPLVLNLHGYTSNNIQQELYGDFRGIADTANFIIVHPNGTLDPQNNHFWNCFGLSQPDDIGFLNSLMDTIEKNYLIDTNRIYATGMSNGGFMSYQLACQSSQRIAAIASVTGSMIAVQQSTCSPQHPMPVMQIHGTADPTVSYTGVGGIIASMPIDSLVKYWVTMNQCNPTPVFNAVPDIVISDLCTAEHYVYQNGLQGSTVEFYKIIGGTHTWPGAPINVGVTNMDFSASKEIWRFFNQYKLNNLLTSTESIPSPAAYEVYPNPSSGVIQIRSNQGANSRIEIYSIDGRRLSSQTYDQDHMQLDIPLPGLYLIKIMIGNRAYQEKICITK